MDKPLFTVIIPTFNRADKLKRALESVKLQTVTDFEVIVCDDGSCDHTKQIVEYYMNKIHLRYVWEENWGGPARPRNNGLRLARGQFVAFLDSDDWWYPKKLETVKPFLKKEDFVFHDLDIVTAKGKKIFHRIKGRHLRPPVFADLLINENPMFNSSVVIRKTLLDKVGEVIEDKAFVSVEDFDLYLRLAKITEQFKYLPKALGAYYMDDESISANPAKRIAPIEAVYEKHIDNLPEAKQVHARRVKNYLQGRLKQKSGLYKEALQHFKESVRSRNMRFKARSLYWILRLSLSMFLFKKKKVQ